MGSWVHCDEHSFKSVQPEITVIGTLCWRKESDTYLHEPMYDKNDGSEN